MEKWHSCMKRHGAARYFLRDAARAGLVLLALTGPARLNADEMAKPAAPCAQDVWRYPNFSGGGVHGNPAIWPEYGNWGFAELSSSPSKETASFSAILSSKLVGDIHGMLKIGATGNTEAHSVSALGVLILSLPYTFRVGIGAGIDSNEKLAAQAGIASVFARGSLLLRNGIDYDLTTGLIHAASEARKSFGNMELTGSAGVSAEIKDGVAYGGQSAGVQLRYRKHLFSFGCGGTKISEWDRLRLHYRIFGSKGTFVDLHLRGKGEGLFSNPDYVGLGITRML